MPDWGQAVLTAAPGLLAAGALWWRVGALEKDIEKRVSRDLFDVHVKNVEAQLARIEALLLARVHEGS